MDILEWKKKNSRPAGYAHFDKKLGLKTKWNYVTNPKMVAQHGFYPFIHYNQVFYKFSKKDGVKDKSRPICYSAHIDRSIYKYYGYLLNEKYNDYTDKEGISNSVVAYRTNLHKNNIHFAKQAFDFIKQQDCDIMVGDFTGFFDNLDHKYLKQMLCKVLEVQTLSEDWYAVFKNITKYSTWELIDILEMNNLINNIHIKNIAHAHKEALGGKTKKARSYIRFINDKIKKLNEKELALSQTEFKLNVKRAAIPNEKSYGIPQGSAISAVLSNVYMIEFDKKIFQYINSLNGLYLRYSDDFIIVIPKNDEVTFEEIKKYLYEVVKDTQRVELEPGKTKIYSYSHSKILNISQIEQKYEDSIDYLGFVFDGKKITLRPKTISKYYYRMYKKLNYIIKCKGITKKGNKISYNNLYRIYTQKGRNGEYDKALLPKKELKVDKNNPYKDGNFFSYVYKADKIFNPKGIIHKEPITQSTKRHMLKIRRKRQKIT